MSSSTQLHFSPHVITQTHLITPVLPAGIRLLLSEELIFPLIFPEIGQMVTFHFRPTVFGFRLYQKQGQQQQAHYQLVPMLDYYHLEQSALYIFTRVNSFVTLAMGSQIVLSIQADTHGICLIENLSQFKQHCSYEQNEVTIDSEELKSTFSIYWTPRIQELTVEESRVALTIDGPRHTGILVRFTDTNNETLREECIACQARCFSIILDGQPPTGKRKPRYLIFMYYLSNNDIIPSAWQSRLVTQAKSIFLDFFAEGLGISDEQLLELYSME